MALTLFLLGGCVHLWVARLRGMHGESAGMERVRSPWADLHLQ